jgi:hypothetical protein
MLVCITHLRDGLCDVGSGKDAMWRGRLILHNSGVRFTLSVGCEKEAMWRGRLILQKLGMCFYNECAHVSCFVRCFSRVKCCLSLSLKKRAFITNKHNARRRGWRGQQRPNVSFQLHKAMIQACFAPNIPGELLSSSTSVKAFQDCMQQARPCMHLCKACHL